MSLFHKRTTRYVLPDGKRATKETPGATKITKAAKIWSCRYRDADGILREASLFKDKTASEQRLAELIRNAERGNAGLIDPFQKHAKRPLVEHLAEFIQDLRNRGRTPDHVDLIEVRVRSLIDASKAKFIHSLVASKIQTALAALQDDGRSQQTINHYLRAIKQFTRWLVRDRRTAIDAMQHLEGGNVKADRRLKRRELSDDELRLLLDAARCGIPSLGLTGWQRFTLYVTALGTGLRASELASLTPRSFGQAGEIATVTIKAAHEKARRGDTLPIQKSLAELLKPWLATLGADEPLWPGKWAEQKRGSKFVQVDLNRARLKWLETAEDDEQRKKMDETDFLTFRDSKGEQADFHSFRHTHISRLNRSGASVKVMQLLARHSTPNLTIGTYSHSGLADLSTAIDKLPPLPMAEPKVLAARMVARPREESGVSVMTADESQADESDPAGNAETPEKQGLSQENQAERVRFELTMPLRTCRFSRPVQSATLPPLRVCIPSRKTPRVTLTIVRENCYRNPGSVSRSTRFDLMIFPNNRPILNKLRTLSSINWFI